MACVSQQIVSRQRLLAVGAAALVGLGASQARATLITDAGYFSGIPTTLINFETDGSGNAITLIQGQRLAMPANAYAPEGVTFSGTSISWANDGNAAFDAAQIIGGSPVNSIPSSLANQFTMTFAAPVQAFGFFVVNNRTADPNGPTFVARDSAGNVIQTAQFGAAFIDGTLTTPTTTADYGFMGIAATQGIASVTITKQAAIFDDLRFSPPIIPAPGALALGAAGALVIIRRRRR